MSRRAARHAWKLAPQALSERVVRVANINGDHMFKRDGGTSTVRACVLCQRAFRLTLRTRKSDLYLVPTVPGEEPTLSWDVRATPGPCVVAAALPPVAKAAR